MGKPITDITENTETGEISFKFMGGKTDGINSITTGQHADGRIYSISGTLMTGDHNSLPKGVYIINGKKMVKE